jgi:hypothetical protein
MNFKTQEIKRITVKSPLIPLFQRGKPPSPPFVKGRMGGIFKTLNCYDFSDDSIFPIFHSSSIPGFDPGPGEVGPKAFPD